MSPSRQRADGFTLIELLVVIAIFALAFALAPTLLSRLPSVRFSNDVTQLVATLQAVRQRAARLHQDLWVTGFTRSGHLVLEIPGGEAVDLPSISEATFEPDDAPNNRGPLRIGFLSDGSATGGALTVASSNRRARLVIEWPTGRVSRDG